MKYEIKDAESWMVFFKSLDYGKEYVIEVKEKNQRTLSQNAAVHKYCTMMAEALNDAGFEYFSFLEKIAENGVSVPWDMEKFKQAWRMVQDAMFDKESTAKLTTAEVSKVYEVVNRKFAELAGVSLQFPSNLNGGQQ